MSMRSWTEDGFGMLLFTNHNEKHVYQFIAQHNAELLPTENELQEALDAGEEFGDILWEYLGEPASWYVANAINKTEGTTIFKGYASCGDTGQEEMIGAEPCYPWTMNEVDWSMTKEKVCDLLQKYADILGIDEVPEYFEAEYFG